MRDIVHIADGAKLESDNKHCSNLKVNRKYNNEIWGKNLYSSFLETNVAMATRVEMFSLQHVVAIFQNKHPR